MTDRRYTGLRLLHITSPRRVYSSHYLRCHVSFTGLLGSPAPIRIVRLHSLLVVRERRFGRAEHPQQVQNTVRKQEDRRTDVAPRNLSPRRVVDKGRVSHSEVRRVEMADVREGQSDDVVSQHMGLVAPVDNAHPTHAQEQVHIPQLIIQGEGAGVERFRRQIRERCLTRDEVIGVKEWGLEARDSALRRLAHLINAVDPMMQLLQSSFASKGRYQHLTSGSLTRTEVPKSQTE